MLDPPSPVCARTSFAVSRTKFTGPVGKERAMGKRGPAPAPTSLRVLRGDQRGRINTDEPKPTDVPIVAPASVTGPALVEWERLAPDLARHRVMTAWDVQAFASYCMAVEIRDKARRQLDEQGEVMEAPVFDRTGKRTGERTVRNPWFAVWMAAAETVLRHGARFGLTPSDRSQLGVGNGRQHNPAGATRLLG